jgi:hypothetical protein
MPIQRLPERAERLAGSAFLLALPDGSLVGVTAAHNLDVPSGVSQVVGPSGAAGTTSTVEQALGTPSGVQPSLILRIATLGVGDFRQEPGQPQLPLEIGVIGLKGSPGSPRRFGLDLSGDQLLLAVEPGGEVYAVEADRRGLAQPGERILLLGGVDNRRHAGTVFEAGPRGLWCLMDEAFEPALLSGSPALSLHTGQVVGMAVAAGWHEGRLIIGLNPIGSLVEAAAGGGG